ncbi:hypothetical protein HLRTI_001314 [Halorhabdus tiamatea SARL4B]|uniref:Uncharacterized protein n=1 Tax=Halorhabdus tiamatea SARL4B TaxID=1033806 RepID=U2E2V1_9EURY|nr:hypothetical protein HLRTI_001314 [Halorhabdus tiamatea SARL4B]
MTVFELWVTSLHPAVQLGLVVMLGLGVMWRIRQQEEWFQRYREGGEDR